MSDAVFCHVCGREQTATVEMPGDFTVSPYSDLLRFLDAEGVPGHKALVEAMQDELIHLRRQPSKDKAHGDHYSYSILDDLIGPSREPPTGANHDCYSSL